MPIFDDLEIEFFFRKSVRTFNISNPSNASSSDMILFSSLTNPTSLHKNYSTVKGRTERRTK